MAASAAAVTQKETLYPRRSARHGCCAVRGIWHRLRPSDAVAALRDRRFRGLPVGTHSCEDGDGGEEHEQEPELLSTYRLSKFLTQIELPLQSISD